MEVGEETSGSGGVRSCKRGEAYRCAAGGELALERRVKRVLLRGGETARAVEDGLGGSITRRIEGTGRNKNKALVEHHWGILFQMGGSRGTSTVGA